MKNHSTVFKSTIHLILLFVLVCGFVLVLPPQKAHADTYTVSNTNDSGTGSLRQAVLDATDGDTIDFDPALAGENIFLESEISITEDLTLDGSGLSPQLKISGDNAVRVFSVTGGPTVSIDHLEIINASATSGGGMYINNSTVNLTNCEFEANSAVNGGAILAESSTLIIDACTFRFNHSDEWGASIHNLTGDITVTNSTFSNNDANFHGGGIYNNGGAITVTHSTFKSNIALNFGAALSTQGGTLNVSNSTLYDNSALDFGGGIYISSGGTATLSNNTLAENSSSQGGGVYNAAGGTLHMTNNILASSRSGGDCANLGIISTNSHNFIEDNTCSPDFNGNARLDELKDNGGPTETMALLPWSLAIDSGNNAACELTDQRRISRPQGTDCDIGAYESEFQWFVNSTDDPGNGTCDFSECTLREAVADATGGDGITFVDDLEAGLITLNSQIVLDKDLTIQGLESGDNIQLSGNNLSRIFNITNTATVDLHYLDFIDGSASIGGGVNNDNGTVTISNCKFDTNTANDGAGINNANGTLSVTDCYFYNNSAVVFGGAINNHGGSFTVANSTFEENRSDGVGGGIFNNIGTFTITNSTLYLNDSLIGGGGVHNYSGTLTLANSTLSANEAPTGGGLFNDANGTISLTNSIIANSLAGGDCVNQTTFALNAGNLIEDNSCSPSLSGDPNLDALHGHGGATATMRPLSGSAAIDGGDDATCLATDQRGVARPHGLHCDIGAFESPDLLIVNSPADPGDGICDETQCTLREAVQVAASGGAITFADSMEAELIILGSEIPLVKNLSITGIITGANIQISGDFSHRIFNVMDFPRVDLDYLSFVDGAANPGGGVNNDNGLVTISNCEFSGNEAVAGGGLNNANGYVTISDCEFTNNRATDLGGAINTYEGFTIVTGSTFAYNSADTAGGAIFNNIGIFTLTNSTLYSNTAAVVGGGTDNFSGTMTVANSTFYANDSPLAGGLVNGNDATLYLSNSIVAGSLNGGDCNNFGTLATNTTNLIEDDTCSPDYSGDPLLGPLTYNGGPTRTMAPQTGSGAIDQGSLAPCPSTDQRGAPRPQGLLCDLGAVESSAHLPVNSLLDPGTGGCNTSECTLREAVQIAVSGDTVTFDPALSGGAINLGTVIEVDKNLTIDGSGLSPHVQVSGGGSVQNFVVIGPVTASFNHLDIFNGFAIAGAGIEVQVGTVLVSNSTLTGNQAETGGAINSSGTLTITNSAFYTNTATTYGGAINNNGGNVAILASTFSGNSTPDFGGGIFNNVGIITITNSTFYNNTAGYGGGIENWQGTLTLGNTTFSGNRAANEGGNLWNSSGGALHMQNSILANSLNGGDCVSNAVLATNTNNLVEDSSCSPALSGDPRLGPLADNGGPTWTIALLFGSHAIDAGDDLTCPATDQRGVSRPVGAHCDIGALESDHPYFVFLPMIER